ncbi:hypothetical protein [Spirulina sp. 06S082]|nr:hypothetical protein [Spirulina sp. 06S082]MEA5468281.1 hypothetical protein [Spirulina sp. 06S082]
MAKIHLTANPSGLAGVLFLHFVEERAFWDDYMAVYEDMFNHTSTKYAP